MKFTSFLKNLLFVPKCASCGERLSPIPGDETVTYGKTCLCESCCNKWQSAKASLCCVCSNTAEKCTCDPKFFKNLQPNIPALCFYHPEADEVQSKIIFSIKHVNDSQLFEFMALELLPRLTVTLEKMGISGENCIFTWVPRKNSSISKYGFDQGKQLCLQIARGFGCQPYPLFLRVGGKEQKKLSRRERAVNAERSITLNSFLFHFPKKSAVKDLKELVSGKVVVLVDDVMTTGSTLKNAVLLLQSIGAAQTVVACIAKTEGRPAHSDRK